MTLSRIREGTMRPLTKPNIYFGRGCWRVRYNPTFCPEDLYKLAMKFAAKLNRRKVSPKIIALTGG